MTAPTITPPMKPERMEPAALLRLFRDLRGWSQEEAADWWGVYGGQVWGRWERGERRVPEPLRRAILREIAREGY